MALNLEKFRPRRIVAAAVAAAVASRQIDNVMADDSLVAALVAARSAVLRMKEEDPTYDDAVLQLLKAEAAAGETFRGGRWSRSTVPNVQFARRMMTQLSAVQSKDAKRQSGDVGDSNGDKDGDSRKRRHRHRHKDDGRDRDRDRDRRRDRDRDTDRDRDHRRRQPDRSRSCSRSRSRERRSDRKQPEAEGGKDDSGCGESGVVAEARLRQLALQRAHELRIPAEHRVEPAAGIAKPHPQPLSWVRKGMRVRLISPAGADVSGVRTAVVSAARDPAAVTLRHDGSGLVLTVREEELLPTVPPVGGSAILLAGEHAGEVGRVTVVCLATRTATVRLTTGSVECHFLDLSEWTQAAQGGLPAPLSGSFESSSRFEDSFGGVSSGVFDEGW